MQPAIAIGATCAMHSEAIPLSYNQRVQSKTPRPSEPDEAKQSSDSDSPQRTFENSISIKGDATLAVAAHGSA
jgi:hypothetical protein